MLKVVVFDGGYGGEILADKIEERLPIIEVIRVIDWRNAEPLLKSPRQARKITLAVLKPYIGRVDLIVIANFLVSLTSLNYFKKTFPRQKFLGVSLPEKVKTACLKAKIADLNSKILASNTTSLSPRAANRKETANFNLKPAAKKPIILTTSAILKTWAFKKYLLKLKYQATVIQADAWPALIDDGELPRSLVEKAFLEKGIIREAGRKEIILTCSQFFDLEPLLRKLFGKQTVIKDGISTLLDEIGQELKIRGGKAKKK